jgi:hypothetical protein
MSEPTATEQQVIDHAIEGAKRLARLPKESSWWHSTTGEEYLSHENTVTIVVNQKLGQRRRRLVCRIIEEVWV